MDELNTLPNAPDPNHEYTFKSGEFGKYYQYWWVDPAGNYYLYSNAAEDSEDYDPNGGAPILNPNQPFAHESPEYFTAEGFKRSQALPPGVVTLLNQKYNPKKLENCWYEYYVADSGDLKYVYLDKDVKENIELYVQHQIRVVDSGITRLRKFAASMFNSQVPRNKTLGCLIMLCDQAFFSPEQLIQATVADIDFIDETVYLLGRKFRCDVNILDYLTELVQNKELETPLFSQDTIKGSQLPFGDLTLMSLFAYLRVSPVFLPYWHATHIFSKIVNKMHLLKIPGEEVQARAFIELANTLGTTDDVTCMVDFQVVNALMDSYGSDQATASIEGTEVQKSFKISAADDFGVAVVRSDLIERRQDELEFSQWLHNTPLHSENVTPEEQQELVEDAQEQGASMDASEDMEESNNPFDNNSEESMESGGNLPGGGV